MTTNDEAGLKSILLSSPPGQFDDILSNLRSILSKSPLLAEHQQQLDSPSFISSLRSEWEKSTGRSILRSSNVGGGDDDGNDEGTTSLRKAMDQYISLKFSSSGVNSAHNVIRDPSSSIKITVYAERIDLHNHNAGSWLGRYALTGSTLSGTVTICAHTFENGGNVHLNSNIALDAVEIKPEGSEASSVTKQIQTWEDEEIMEKLHEMYDSINSKHLKSLRRVMPITRTKMEWNVMAHRVVNTLGEGHGKEKFKH